MTRVLPIAAFLVVTACGGQSRPPQLTGELGDVVVQASFAGEPAPASFNGPLMLDSISFGRLAMITQQAVVGSDRPVEMVDPRDVLECPDQAPCHVRGDRMFMSVWDAVAADDTLAMVVSRTYNVERLYTMTTSVIHRMKFQRVPGGWRLTERRRLPT